MVSLRQKLPPLTSLTAFEAAARHLNFTRAAKDLNVTQAAVSRQIQGLEEYLGVPLFRRLHRAMQLTREGDRLHRAVTIGLEQIASAVVDIRRERHGPEVTVATSVTFASYWLMSRIAKFRAAHPEVELRLVASGPISDLAAAGIDLAVRHGRGRWPGLEAEHLLDNEIYPVCVCQRMAHRPADLGVVGHLLRQLAVDPPPLRDEALLLAPPREGEEAGDVVVVDLLPAGGVLVLLRQALLDVVDLALFEGEDAADRLELHDAAALRDDLAGELPAVLQVDDVGEGGRDEEGEQEYDDHRYGAGAWHIAPIRI